MPHLTVLLDLGIGNLSKGIVVATTTIRPIPHFKTREGFRVDVQILIEPFNLRHEGVDGRQVDVNVVALTASCLRRRAGLERDGSEGTLVPRLGQSTRRHLA